MSEHIIKMPDIGEGIAEVELVAWHVAVGDAVTEDQPLADVMTDKATVEIPSPVVGRVVALGGKVGDVMAVGGEMIRIDTRATAGESAGGTVDAADGMTDSTTGRTGSIVDAAHGTGETIAGTAPAEPQADGEVPAAMATRSAQSNASTSSGEHSSRRAPAKAAVADHHEHAQAQPPTQAPAQRSAPTPARSPAPEPTPPREPGQRPLASPAVRKRAWDMGIELRFVTGTGPAGRIDHGDLDAYLQGARAPAPGESTREIYRERHDETVVQVVGLRRKIAQKMQEAKRRIPHFTYVEEVDVTELESLRAKLNQRWGETRGRLTVLPLLARAMVIALRDFPQLNARFDDEAGAVTRYGAVHLGIATQTDGGLMVPVIKHAEARDVWALGAEIARLAQASRTGKIEREALTGSTITLTSLGALGGLVSTPVINHPEVGIVGVNRIIERPMFHDKVVVARKLMNVSSSFDHRVVDGMDAAEFIQAVRALLEQPALLFVE